jgi:hypothetical protein
MIVNSLGQLPFLSVHDHEVPQIVNLTRPRNPSPQEQGIPGCPQVNRPSVEIVSRCGD